MKKIISVIIPCYNLEKYIEKSIKSVLLQTYKAVEIIVVDDGSTDNSVKICEDLKKSYSNIKVIRQTNQGVSNARNQGFFNAKGKYVCFLDGDDYLDEKCLEEVIEKFNDDVDLDICAYGFQEVSEEGIVIKKYKDTYIYPSQSLTASDALLLKCMRKIGIYNGSCVYKKSLLDKYEIRHKEGYKYGEDINFINTSISYAKKIDYIKKDYFNCLVRCGSATRSGINSAYIHAVQLNRMLLNTIKERNELSIEDKEKMIIASDVDYIYLLTACGKNIVENLGVFSSSKAKFLYNKFEIFPDYIDMPRIDSYLTKLKKIEWNLFCNHKILFFYMVKIYRILKG